MWSAEGEDVPFSESVFATGNVEYWLLNIEKMMVKSLYDSTKKAWKEYPEDPVARDKWLLSYPAQPVLTVDLIMWTKGVTEALQDIYKGINRAALEEYLEDV